MTHIGTPKRLAELTDQGAFERLAMAVLRICDPQYRYFGHPGVNADGKTVKAPLDGAGFVPGADPPHMICAQHTTCLAKDLRAKWLHDPSTVKPRGLGKRPTAPAGDVVKSLEIVADWRKRLPNLQATLVLTTNHEPDQDVVRDVLAFGTGAGVAIDMWPRSRIAHALDNDPHGQWIRKDHLGIDQVLLSDELLSELSRNSLKTFAPADRPDAWVDRDLDRAFSEARGEPVVFLVAPSGSGKSVACHKRLRENVDAGGFGLVIMEEIVASSLSLEQAIEKTLQQLHPALATGCGSAALSFAAPHRPMLLQLDDVSRSGHGATLIDKICRWSKDAATASGACPWQILCPVWPQVMALLGDDERKREGYQTIVGSAFTVEEGCNAVELRYQLHGRTLSRLEAEAIAAALGQDPLLIALHNPAAVPDTTQTIEQFVASRFSQLAATRQDFTAGEYNRALLVLGQSMLLELELEPDWLTFLASPRIATHAPALRHILHQGEVVRLVGTASAERLTFRHDRVREWLLAQAAFDSLRNNALPPSIAAEPYFAEIFGLALARHDALESDISFIAAVNPLALFCAVPHFVEPPTSCQQRIVAAIEAWLAQPSSNDPRHHYLRWDAMRVLAGVEHSCVLPLVERLDDGSRNALRARYRNLELSGGIGLCFWTEPGVRVQGQDAFFEHVKTRFGARLIKDLGSILEHPHALDGSHIGALRLAGYIREPSLADSVRASWGSDASRQERLRGYLWSSAQCVDDDPATLLGPVCDAWAALPSQSTDPSMPSRRDELASMHVKFAFRMKPPPDQAVAYFIQRAATAELKWPITYMLHGVDHPDAIEFVVREMAVISEATNGMAAFILSANDDWRRQQYEDGRPMSETSRARLLGIWQDASGSAHLREQAFRMWASTFRLGDIEVLQSVADADTLAGKALWRRLQLGDRTAIPLLLPRLLTDQAEFWWQAGRYIWSDEMALALDAALDRRRLRTAAPATDSPAEQGVDHVLPEMIMRLPPNEADAMLYKHWDHLADCGGYVIAALYIATPRLKERVAESMRSASDPAQLLKHLSWHLGHRVKGRPGVFRPEQVEALVPYLDLLDKIEIHDLWTTCNENRWFSLRQRHLDNRLSAKYRDWIYLDEPSILAKLEEFHLTQSPWVNHWLDDFLKTGASVDVIVGMIQRWLDGKSDIESLRLACDAILHIGQPRHLEALKVKRFEPDSMAELVANTEFGLRRRSLSRV